MAALPAVPVRRRCRSTTCEVASLYEIGWRQGSLVDASLPIGGLLLDGDGCMVVARAGTHSAWVVTTQDCDLAGWEQTRTEPLVELRARFPLADPAAEWGIRSRLVRLDENECAASDEPPIRLSPAALMVVSGGRTRPRVLASERVQALKTWLGRRYDRPAVPKHFVALARDIAERAQRSSQRPFVSELHDVLMQFDDQSSPPRFKLFAVVRDAGDREVARRWLNEVGTAVPYSLGVLASLDAGYKSETSLELIETSYAADLSRLSWPGPEPHGAI